MTRFVSVFLAAALAVAAAPSWAQQLEHPAMRPDLAGIWELNESLSEDVPPLPGEAVTRALNSASGVSSARRRSTGRVDHQEVARVRTLLRTSFDAATRLSFTENGRVLTLADGAAYALPLTPDGRKTRHDHRGVLVEVVSEWDQPALRVERRYPDGTIIIDSYATFSAPRQLVVTSTIRNVRMEEAPVTVRRVYDHVK